MSDAEARITAAIVDDEGPARALVREYLAAHPDIEVVAECANGFEAVKAIGEIRPKLVFLDIQMPKLDGFEVLELIEPGPAVVFCTAYDEHALKAFEIHAADYLLKPFGRERFAEALARARARLREWTGAPSGKPAMPRPTALAHAARPPGRWLERVLVKDGAKVHVIPMEKLDYLEAQDDYVAIHSEGREWLKNQPLAELERGLDPARFVARAPLVRDQPRAARAARALRQGQPDRGAQGRQGAAGEPRRVRAAQGADVAPMRVALPLARPRP